MRSFTKAIVLASAWKMPFFAPASIAMLAIVMCPAIGKIVHRRSVIFDGAVRRAVDAERSDGLSIMSFAKTISPVDPL